jgi:nucleoside-diphosphate-sugar epimerase
MILVTGASGFVGQHVVNALVDRFSRNSIRLFDIKPPLSALPVGVQFICGAIEEPSDSAESVRGAEVVVHLAAKVQPDSREFLEMWRINVEGTRSLYLAAVDCGCKLFVHMSSAGVYGSPVSPNPFNENDVVKPLTPYQRTKWAAEVALRNSDPKDTMLNILRPAGIYGPGSNLEIPGYKKVFARRSTVEVSGGIIVHPTHVRDVVEAIFAILQRPAPHGTVFNIGGERPLRLQDLQGLVAKTLGVPRRRLVLPPWLAGPLSGAAEPLLALMGQPNPLRVGICQGHVFSAAVDDRRFRQRYPNVPVVNLEDGLREHIEWARAQHLL